MKKALSLFLLSFTSLSYSQQQDWGPKAYADQIHVAESLFVNKNYKASALAYSAAFKSVKYKMYRYDFYNAGCAWALCGYPDSAFVNLYRIVNNGFYKDYNEISNDLDLISLHQDKRWQPLVKKVLQNNNAKK